MRATWPGAGSSAEGSLSARARQDIFADFAFCLPPGEQMLGYPVAGPGNDLRPGHRSYNWVWYRPAGEDADLPRLLTDRDGRTHSISIPPPLIAPAVIAEMRAHAEEVLAPQFREVVRLTEQPFLQPIYDLEATQMAFGRVALVGDAAFVARPHVGAGVAKAAQDASALVRALRSGGDTEAALRRFEAERLYRSAAASSSGRGISALTCKRGSARRKSGCSPSATAARRR